MRCIYCRKANLEGATFCIHCGEPLDEESVAAWVGDDPGRAAWQSASAVSSDGDGGWWRERKLEIVVGIALVLAIIGFVVSNYVAQESQASHYRAARDASGHGQLEAAAQEYAAAGDYLDSPARLSDTKGAISRASDLYDRLKQDAVQGKWWQAAMTALQIDGVRHQYEDTPAILARARAMNGPVVYRLGSGSPSGKSALSAQNGLGSSGVARLESTGGDGAIYVAQADGGNPKRIPKTDASSVVRGVSPDGEWVVVSTHCGETGSDCIILYSVSRDDVRKLYVPADKVTDAFWASLGIDSQLLWLTIDDTRYSFNLQAARTTGLLYGNTSEPALSRELGSYKTILVAPLSGDPDRTVVTVAGWRATSPLDIAIEDGKVDGAVFSDDQRYLLYRVCPGVDARGALACTLRFVSLDSLQPTPITIAAIPVRRPGDTRNWVEGQFTRDGEHILMVERYNGERESHIYSIQSGKTYRLPGAAGGEGEESLASAPLFAGAVSGLEFWSGPNSLAFTMANIEVGPGDEGYTSRLTTPDGGHLPFTTTLRRWVTVAPDDRYAVYLGGREAEPFNVYTIPLEEGGSPRITPSAEPQVLFLLGGAQKKNDWAGNIYLLADGYTMLATIPPRPDFSQGLYAYDLATGSATMVVESATDLHAPDHP